MCITKKTLKLYWKTFLPAIGMMFLFTFIIWLVNILFSLECYTSSSGEIICTAFSNPRLEFLYFFTILLGIGSVRMAPLPVPMAIPYSLFFWTLFLIFSVLSFSLIYKLLSSRRFFKKYFGVSIINFISMVIGSIGANGLWFYVFFRNLY